MANESCRDCFPRSNEALRSIALTGPGRVEKLVMQKVMRTGWKNGFALIGAISWARILNVLSERLPIYRQRELRGDLLSE